MKNISGSTTEKDISLFDLSPGDLLLATYTDKSTQLVVFLGTCGTYSNQWSYRIKVFQVEGKIESSFNIFSGGFPWLKALNR